MLQHTMTSTQYVGMNRNTRRHRKSSPEGMCAESSRAATTKGRKSRSPDSTKNRSTTRSTERIAVSSPGVS
jgi:hypothetical protein